MNITPLFPIPIGRVYNFITPKERLHLLKHIKSIPHFPNGAIEGDGSSTFDDPPNLLDRNIKRAFNNIFSRIIVSVYPYTISALM